MLNEHFYKDLGTVLLLLIIFINLNLLTVAMTQIVHVADYFSEVSMNPEVSMGTNKE
jgi:hypothetical protein